MSDSITFWVPGVPIAQGSKTVVPMRRGGRRMIEHANLATKTKPANRLRDWRDAVTWAAKLAGAKRPIEGPISLRLVFYFERPRSSKRAHPDVKPDLSKLVRAVEDALTGFAWKDDAQVVALATSKAYLDLSFPPDRSLPMVPGVQVSLRPLPPRASRGANRSNAVPIAGSGGGTRSGGNRHA